MSAYTREQHRHAVHRHMVRYRSPFVKPVEMITRIRTAVKHRARQSGIVLVLTAQQLVTVSAEQVADAVTMNDSADPNVVAAGGRRAHVFPDVGRKLSVMAIGQTGGRSLLDFVERLFAVIIPEALWFFSVLLFFLVLAKFLPHVFLSMLERVGASANRQIAVYYITRCGLIFFGLYVAFKSIGIDMLGLAVMFGVSAIIVTALLTDIIVNSISGVLIHCIGAIQPGNEVIINGVHGTVLAIGHFHVYLRLIEPPYYLVLKPNHECFTGTVFINDGVVRDSPAVRQGLDESVISELDASDISRKNV